MSVAGKRRKNVAKALFKNSRMKLLEIFSLSHLRPFILQTDWRLNSCVSTDLSRAGGFWTIEGEIDECLSLLVLVDSWFGFSKGCGREMISSSLQ